MDVVDKVISATVGLLLIAYVGVEGLKSLTITGFTGGGVLATLNGTVLPIIGVIVFLIIVVSQAKKSKSSK